MAFPPRHSREQNRLIVETGAKDRPHRSQTEETGRTRRALFLHVGEQNR
jgi:hypothetical protein